MFAPAKTPRGVVDRLNREIVNILKAPDTGQRLLALGVEAAPTTPAELDRFVVAQVKEAIELARSAGIKPE
jgi:tripartite-type tricarboxylate transporter receptor subunit TctC